MNYFSFHVYAVAQFYPWYILFFFGGGGGRGGAVALWLVQWTPDRAVWV